jgi:molybdopterin biosynthesis enzyme
VLAAVRELLPGADMLVTSGGIGMGGEHDAVKATPRDLGAVSFGKVAIQPGMPQGQQQGTVTPALGRSTHRLAALGRSNAQIVVPECVTALAAAAPVEVLELQR